MATDSPFEDQIKQALWTKDVDAILRLCDDSSHRTSILGYKKDGKQLVHFAAQFGSVLLLDKLRGFGSDLKLIIDDTYGYHHGGGSTPLHIACKHGNIEVVEYLLKTVQDISFNNAATVQGMCRNYRNAFYYAAQSGNTDVVKCLQTLGKLDINEILPHNQTALSICVAERNSKSAKILCECGANVNLGKFDRGLKPIQYLAEKHGSSETMKVLLNFGANVNEPWVKIARRSCLRQSPLFMALKHGIGENAKTLIECGADVSFVGQTSNTDMGSIGCFSLAAKRCPELISDFLKYGANPNERHNGKSVLMTVMDDYASKSAIQALVEAGADVNQRKNGKTLIQCCQNYGKLV
ncbi:unnamed protein product [Mytilus coruscus]|uniref:Uncharacterized protein n=1 Tax=Mytilus coruscus TaxID=42192 RepID=A0A6J8BJS9_MYTCO|nr:unnamed protein product [Mytilus coruscus]